MFTKGKIKINSFWTAHGKGTEERGDLVGALPARDEPPCTLFGGLAGSSSPDGAFLGC